MSKEPTKESGTNDAPGVSRREFLRRTALVTGVSVGASRLVVPSAVDARPMEGRLAQAAPPSGARSQSVPSPAPPTQQAPPPPDVELEQFIRLSATLTGLKPLEPDLAQAYFDRCALRPSVAEQMKRLVDVHGGLHGTPQEMENELQAKLADASTNDKPLFAAAEQIIYLWYIGAFYNIPDPPDSAPGEWEYGPPAHYFRGKVWRVLGVTPPMSPGGSATFWAKKPRIAEVTHG